MVVSLNVCSSLAQHLQLADSARWVGHDRLQQAREMLRHARDRVRLEQVSAVFETSV